MSTQKPKTAWYDRHLWSIQPVRDVLLIASVFGVLYIGWMLSLVTVPLLLAVLLAYLFEPVIKRLVGVGMSRQFAAGLVVFFAGLVVAVPLVLGTGYAAWQGVNLGRSIAQNSALMSEVVASDGEGPTVEDLPRRGGWRTVAGELLEIKRQANERDALAEQYEAQLDADADADADARELAAELEGSAAGAASLDDEVVAGDEPIVDANEFAESDSESDGAVGVTRSAVERADRAVFLLDLYERTTAWVREHAGQIGREAVSATGDAFGFAYGIAKAVGLLGFQGFLTAFFFFFASTGYGGLQRFGTGMIPGDRRGRIVELLGMMDRVVSGFVRGRLTIAGIQSLFFMAGYFVIGAPAAILLGLAVGVLSIVPYMALIGIPVSIGLMFFESADGFRGAWWWVVFAPMVVYQLGQMLDDYVLTPWIQGKSTDLDTPTVLFASIAGGILAGVYGLLIAIPIAACIKIVIREVLWPTYLEWVEGTRSDPLPVDTQEEREQSSAG